MEIGERAKKIKLLLMDCDGVLTDGRLYFSADGEAMKVFDVKDGQGIALWHAAGFQSGIISGRGAESIIRKRTDELGMNYVRTSSKDKRIDFYEILAAAGVSAEETAYVGDDVGDMDLLKLAALSFAVKDAVPEVRYAVDYVTEARGGRGAVREIIEFLLRS